jgi:hypothetical protein
MLLFLDNVPFADHALEVEAPWATAPIRLKPFQTVVTISLTHPHAEAILPGAPRLPALVDTGNNHTLTLRTEHLLASGLTAPFSWGSQPLKVRDASGTEMAIQRLLVDVWLHSNRPELANHPYRVRLGARGAACYPTAGLLLGPPIPLLGLALFCAGSIELNMLCRPTGGVVKVFVPDMPWL